MPPKIIHPSTLEYMKLIFHYKQFWRSISAPAGEWEGDEPDFKPISYFLGPGTSSFAPLMEVRKQLIRFEFHFLVAEFGAKLTGFCDFGKLKIYAFAFLLYTGLYIILFQCFLPPMSDILEISWRTASTIFSTPADPLQKQRTMAKMKKFYEIKSMTAYRENESFFVLLDSQHFSHCHTVGLDLFGVLEIQMENTHVQFNLGLFDCDSNQIKALSTHQKTGLAKFCNLLSCDSSSLSISCDTLTGKLKFAINYFTIQINPIIDFLEQVLHICESHKKIIGQILQFLELIPHCDNAFLQKISAKMKKCRYVLLGPHQEEIDSASQLFHQEYYFTPVPDFQVTHCWLWETQNRIFLAGVLEKFKASLKCAPSAKKTNCLHLQLLESPKQMVARLEGLMTIPKRFKKMPDPVVQTCQLANQQSVAIEFSLKLDPRMDQIQKIERMSKHTYYKFLREYIVFRNFDMANTFFLAYKYQKMTPLNEYLNLHKTSLSFLTRLNLCQQLAGIGCIGLTMKKFAPSYASENIMVTSGLQVKLNSILHEKHSIASVQIAQTCYKILFGVHCTAHNVVQEEGEIKMRKWINVIKSIDDGQSRLQGVSVINFWLKKVLLDIVGNDDQNEMKRQVRKREMNEQNCSWMGTEISLEQSVEQGPHSAMQLGSLEKLLFVVSLAYKTYSEFFNYRLEIFDDSVEL